MAVVMSVNNVMHNNRGGKSILTSSQTLALSISSWYSDSPKNVGNLVPVMMMMTFATGKQDVFYSLLADVHGREQEVYRLSISHECLNACVSETASARLQS